VAILSQNNVKLMAFISHSPVSYYHFQEVPGTDFYDKNMVNSWNMYGIPTALSRQLNFGF
jgi:hypothetical protein